MTLILSIFPGIGLLDMAFEEEGYCVVRGPDVIWGGDVRRFHPPAGVFDGVIGGPPCQMFSALASLVRAGGREPRFGNLIPEYERVVAEARPRWFLMENVPAAPEPAVPGYATKSFLLDNSHLAADDGMGQEQRRVRRITFGTPGPNEPPSLLRWIDLAVFLLPDSAPAVIGGGGKPEWAVTDKEAGRVRTRCGSVTSAAVNNSPEAKRRVPPVTAGHEQPAGLTARKKARRQPAVTSSDGGPSERMGRYKLADALRLQGFPESHLDHCPFTAEGKLKAVANGVPLPMGRAMAKAVREATLDHLCSSAEAA